MQSETDKCRESDRELQRMRPKGAGSRYVTPRAAECNVRQTGARYRELHLRGSSCKEGLQHLEIVVAQQKSP